MEKDITPAALRRAALSRSALAARPAKGASSKASAPTTQQNEPPKARATTRQRQIQETRTQMLERLTNPMISLHEASVLLRVCSATVRRLANDGELPHIRTPGGQRRFYLLDVLQVLEDREGERHLTGLRKVRSKARSSTRSTSNAPASNAAPPRKEEATRPHQGLALLEATRARAAQRAQGTTRGAASSGNASALGAKVSARDAAQETASRLAAAPRLRLSAVRARADEGQRASPETPDNAHSINEKGARAR
jgi:excisionase family DNA binding protein